MFDRDLQDPKPVVLCLHSSGSNGSQWHALRESLGGRYEVRTPNLIGYGDKPFAAGSQHSISREVDALLAGLGGTVDKVHLVGHSYGAAVATHFALWHPDKVASVTLYEPVLFTMLFEDGPNTAELREIRKIASVIVESADSDIGRWRAAREFINYWSGSDAWRLLSDRQHGRFAALTPKVGAEFGALIGTSLRQSDLASLSVPLRLLCGTHTRRPARRIAELVAAGIPGIQLEMLTGLAHMAPVTDSDVVNPLIIEHLDRSSNIPSEQTYGWGVGDKQAMCVPDDGRSR